MSQPTISEWCPECGEFVEPFVQDNVGFCPHCRGTTKDKANNVQIGPDIYDVYEPQPKGKFFHYTRNPGSKHHSRRQAGRAS